MKTFTDKEGRSWDITLTVGSAKRVRDLLDVNLLEPEAGDPPLITRIGTDEILLCDIIYCLCRPQAQSRSLTDEQFGELLCGDVILAAQEAFYAEMLDFFRLRARKDRAMAIRKQMEVIRLAVSRAEKEIDAFPIEQEIEKAFGPLSTSSPASPVSTPIP